MNPSAWRIVLDIGTAVLVAAGGCALAWRCLRKSVDPARLVFKWIFSAGLIFALTRILPHFPEWTWPIIVVPFGIALGVTWASAAGSLMAGLITNSMDGGDVPVEAQPFYSVAETKRRNGQPQEAVALVREQLEEFPGDFRGVMLLASILAEDLQDLPGAQLTLEGWMDGPAATPQGLASALTAIADWHLQFARNPEGARAALQRIVRELPDSPAAHQAAQRLAHLPTAEYMAEGRTAAPVGLRPGGKDIGLRKEETEPGESSPDPDALAEEYVKQLEKHPSDTATREKLALLYAGHFHRLDLAVDQVEQLIALPTKRRGTLRNGSICWPICTFALAMTWPGRRRRCAASWRNSPPPLWWSRR